MQLVERPDSCVWRPAPDASGLIKLKPGSEEKVEEWRSTIASRLDEAAATLKDEDVQVESWFTEFAANLVKSDP